MYGTTKLDRGAYRANIEATRKYFKDNPNDEWDGVDKLEKILDDQSRRLMNLNTEIEMFTK